MKSSAAEKALERIKQLVSMKITCNRQAVLRKEVLLRQEKKELNREECYRRLRDALELTLPYEKFLEPGEKYLTHEEQSCIRNMMVDMCMIDVTDVPGVEIGDRQGLPLL